VIHVLGFIFGWPRKIRKLRKRWDRLREKSLKKKGLVKKTALEKLDMIEQKLRTLEEQKITRLDRSRLSREIEIDLAEIKAMMDSTPDEIMQAQRPITSQQAQRQQKLVQA
jgi:DNA-binding transcriptional MerR regulator